MPHLAHDLDQVERLHDERSLSGVGEQLLRQLACSPSGELDTLDARPRGRVGREVR